MTASCAPRDRTPTVTDYAEALTAGAIFPPVVVFSDGSAFWLADGFHRLKAHREAGLAEIACEVRDGTQRDAVLYSPRAPTPTMACAGPRRTGARRSRLCSATRSGATGQTRRSRGAPTAATRRLASYGGDLSGDGGDAEFRVVTFATRHGTEATRVVPTAAPASLEERVLRGLPDDVAARRGPAARAGGRLMHDLANTRSCGPLLASKAPRAGPRQRSFCAAPARAPAERALVRRAVREVQIQPRHPPAPHPLHSGFAGPAVSTAGRRGVSQQHSVLVDAGERRKRRAVTSASCRPRCSLIGATRKRRSTSRR